MEFIALSLPGVEKELTIQIERKEIKICAA